MKNFKHIEMISNGPRHKLIKTFNEDGSFLMEFELVNDKIKTKFIKKFKLLDMTFWQRIKYCYRILVNKEMKMESEFEYKDGEHAVDVSDTLFMFSREIHKNNV
jgi:hypothetical protein